MNKIFVLAFSILLAGCLTSAPTKEQIGNGRYTHIKTTAGNLIGQTTYRYSLDCELNLKNAWSSLASNGVEAKCSNEDISNQLPFYLTIVSSDNVMVPLEYRFISSEVCEATANEIQQNSKSRGNAVINNRCAYQKTSHTPPANTNTDKPNQSEQIFTNRENKLKELKRLFDAGLISSEVYKEQQKSILQ